MQSSLEKHINNLETILELEGEEGQFEYQQYVLGCEGRSRHPCQLEDVFTLRLR